MIGKVWLKGHWYCVEYEGLHRICSVYGCYGHLAREYKSNQDSSCKNVQSAEVTRTMTQERRNPDTLEVLGSDGNATSSKII